MIIDEKSNKALNSSSVKRRLNAVKRIKKEFVDGTFSPEKNEFKDVNNHIHSIYSFSPYSPSAAVINGWNAGLKTIGLMDHDSIAGAEEFIAASNIMGIASTVGVECRVKIKDPFFDRRINNPDQNGIAYVSIHGIPHSRFKTVDQFFKPLREYRNLRNEQMTEKINHIFSPYGIELDFENDIVSISQYKNGGSITERHILFSLGRKMIDKFGKDNLVAFLTKDLGLNLSEKNINNLSDMSNPFFEYDLLGLLKSSFITSIYIDADRECVSLEEFVSFAKEVGGISAYPYLGDVTNSVTGDKKAQKFEDDYLEKLFFYLKEKGINAITYMPSRNTVEQLKRVQKLARELSLFEISGEDINSPRQQFICYKQRDDIFASLYDAAWALIAHEQLATEDPDMSLFSQKTIKKYPDLNKRIDIYSEIAKKKYL